MKSRTIARIGIVLIVVATILSAVNIVFGIVAVPSGNEPGAQLTGTVKNVLGIVEYICYAAAVILLIMLGIKYMASAPDAKAEVKKMAVFYIIGAVLVFAAGAVLRFINSVSSSAINSGTAETTQAES